MPRMIPAYFVSILNRHLSHYCQFQNNISSLANVAIPLFYHLRAHLHYMFRMIHSVRVLQYIPRNMHTVFALLCFVVVIHLLIFPYPSGLLHWHCGNLTIAPVPAKQPWWIGKNTSCEFIMNDCITTTKQSTTKPCAYFLGYTVSCFVVVVVNFIHISLPKFFRFALRALSQSCDCPQPSEANLKKININNLDIHYFIFITNRDQANHARVHGMDK